MNEEIPIQSVAGRDVLVLSSDNPAHDDMIFRVKNSGVPDNRFGELVSVEIHVISLNDVSISSTQWISNDGSAPWHKREFRTRSGGKLTKFNAEVPSGDNILLFRNGPKSGHALIRCATQNALFTTGAGNKWSDSFIGHSYVEENGFTVHPDTYIEIPNLDPGEEMWIRMSVLSDNNYTNPYLGECGAIGPNWSQIDNRICKELPVSAGNPVSRAKPKQAHGLIQNWDTSKCGGNILPDSLVIKLSGDLEECGHLVMCRMYGGNYITGFVWNNKGYRIIIEQVNPIVVGKVSPTNPWEIMALNDDNQSGSADFRCTLMEWDSCGCSGTPANVKTIDVLATCNPFSGAGSWGNVGIRFDAIDNVVLSDSSKPEQYHIKLAINHTVGANVGSLAAGKYIVTISQCCVLIDGVATGHVRIVYNGKHGTTQRTFPRQPARNLNQAKQMYQGSTIKIEHTGGPVSVDLVSGSSRFDGEVEVTFTAESLYSMSPQQTEMAPTDCAMHAKHMQLVQDRWTNSNCIGLVAEVLGQEYIVVLTDDKIPCIGNGVAVAWPTLNSTTMVGVPIGGTIPFKVDKLLSESVINDIASGRYISAIGDTTKIKTVMFPVVR